MPSQPACFQRLDEILSALLCDSKEFSTSIRDPVSPPNHLRREGH